MANQSWLISVIESSILFQNFMELPKLDCALEEVCEITEDVMYWKLTIWEPSYCDYTT